MQRILVVCGAGASSTFLVHWMRRAADSRGLQLTIEAGSQDDVAAGLPHLSAVLVGSHLADAFPRLREAAAAAGVPALLLPPLGFDAAGASSALDLLEDLLASSAGASSADHSSASASSAHQGAAIAGPRNPGSPRG